MIRHDEPWIQIASLDDQNRIYFTDEFREIMGNLGWEAEAFVGHLLGLWTDSFEHMKEQILARLQELEAGFESPAGKTSDQT